MEIYEVQTGLTVKLLGLGGLVKQQWAFILKMLRFLQQFS